MGLSDKNTKNLDSIIHMLPKTELHIHAEATVSYESYHELNQKYQANPSLKSPEDFNKLLEITSLKDMIKNFFFLQTLFKKPEDFLYFVKDVHSYALRNNIVYMELYISPSMVLRQGLVDFDDMIAPVLEGFENIAKKGGPDIKLIIDISRSFGFDNAKRNLDLTLRYRTKTGNKRIVGIGLGGQESGNPCIIYKPLFKQAQEAGLYTVAHAGEEVGPESVWDAVKELGASRIGHGTSSLEDAKLLDYMREHGVALEICPKSNIVTGKYVTRYEDHPIRAFYDKGLLVTVNTDDPVLFNIQLDQEYLSLAQLTGFDDAEVFELMRNGIKASFMSAGEKAKSLAQFEAALNTSLAKSK